MLTVVLGGARSGKSRHAQSLCGDRPVVYVATARVDDDPEMRDRIARHRASRSTAWTTVEEPLDVAEAVLRARPAEAIVVVDCITVWLSNLMWQHRTMNRDMLETTARRSIEDLMTVARDRDVIAISNEVGHAVVPGDPVSRQFRDLHGFVNQLLAHDADRVVLLVAGLPITLKGNDQEAR